MHLTTQNKAVNHVFPCDCYYPIAFYLSLWGFHPFSFAGQFQPSLAYIFTYVFTFRRKGLVGMLYLFNPYALRCKPAFRNLTCYLGIGI
nr:MAG TPA: hypothetical protein [Caudoviricetes sp.]